MQTTCNPAGNAPIAIGLHGGCGVMAEHEMSQQEWEQARADLKEALVAGFCASKARRSMRSRRLLS
jgi:beta-aspartyl-peptidase (threonine type)